MLSFCFGFVGETKTKQHSLIRTPVHHYPHHTVYSILHKQLLSNTPKHEKHSLLLKGADHFSTCEFMASLKYNFCNNLQK